jgi:hypothetical protein
MEEIINEVKAGIKDRLRNQFIGAFAISWLVVNWKPVVCLFVSQQPIESRVAFITKNYSHWEFILALPFLFSVIYLVGLPYLNFTIEWLQSDSLERRGSLSLERDKANILRETEREIARIDLEKAKSEHQSRDRLNKEIEQLKADLKIAVDGAEREREEYKESIKNWQLRGASAEQEQLRLSEAYEDRLATLQEHIKKKDEDNLSELKLRQERQKALEAQLIKLAQERELAKADRDQLAKQLQELSSKGLGDDRQNADIANYSKSAQDAVSAAAATGAKGIWTLDPAKYKKIKGESEK